MLRNWEVLREHQRFTAEIREERQKKEERKILEMKAEAAVRRKSIFSGFGVDSAEAENTTEVGTGNMNQRCAAIKEQLTALGVSMEEHRGMLDDVHAVRRATAEAKGEVYQPMTVRPRAMPDTSWSQAVKDGSRWMHPGLQGAAWVKARDQEDEEQNQEKRESQGINNCFLSDVANDAQDKSAANTTGGRTTRPSSANSFKGNPLMYARPLSAVSTATSSKPKSRPGSQPVSRPPSAGSMKARCRALEEGLMRNMMTMKAQKADIGEVVSYRQNLQERMIQALVDEFKKPA